jgi:hypothetical protein
VQSHILISTNCMGIGVQPHSGYSFVLSGQKCNILD